MAEIKTQNKLYLLNLIDKFYNKKTSKKYINKKLFLLILLIN